jgi:hypothetical protein
VTAVHESPEEGVEASATDVPCKDEILRIHCTGTKTSDTGLCIFSKINIEEEAGSSNRYK